MKTVHVILSLIIVGAGGFGGGFVVGSMNAVYQDVTATNEDVEADFAGLLARTRPAAEIEVECTLDLLIQKCTFRNVGSERGARCVAVVVVNPRSGRRVPSNTLCSAELAPGEERTVPFEVQDGFVFGCGLAGGATWLEQASSDLDCFGVEGFEHPNCGCDLVIDDRSPP